MANFQRDQAVTLLSDYLSLNAQSTNFSTPGHNIQQFKNFSFQLNVTSQSSLNVAVKVQATLDNANWSDVPSSSIAITANGSYLWNYSGAAYIAVRLTFTFTAGSALFQVYAFETT
jgi:hypothetical protein